MFCKIVQNILRTKAVVSSLEPYEIRDMDCLEIKEKVEEAIKRGDPDVSNLKLKVTSVNSRRLKVIIVAVPELSNFFTVGK